MSEASVPPESGSAPLIELRLALVCYGGVSLAIYMHGLTKELHHLVRAARAFDAAYDDDPGLSAAKNPFGATDTESAYFDALVELARAGHPLRVVLDVLTGTSAGGINAVFLGHALAHGRSLAPLRDLWLQRADINRLLDARPHPGGSGVLVRGYLMGSALLRTLLARQGRGAPLNGTLMCRLVQNALGEMGPVATSLVPSDGSLDLVVTGTNVLGVAREIPTGAGGVSHDERVYHQTFRFRWDAGAVDDFSDAAVPALGFAARVTSSFPGAFAPVSMAGYADAVGPQADGAAVPLDPIAARLGVGDAVGAAATVGWFMDGGVIDNGPFDHAIDLIAAKRAQSRVARELVFIEPDPVPVHPGDGDKQPPLVTVVQAALLTIPERQAFLSALDRLRTMNDTINRIGALVERQQDEVNRVLPSAATRADYGRTLDDATAVRNRARDCAGLTYGSYCRLRAESVATEIVTDLADRLGYAETSDRAAFVRAVATAWVRDHDYWRAADPVRLEEALGPVDVAFRRRRLHFLLQGINAGLADADVSNGSRHRLQAVKSACWDLLERLRALTAAAVGDPAVLAACRPVFGADVLDRQVIVSDPEAYAKAHCEALGTVFAVYRGAAGFHGSSERLWSLLTGLDDELPDLTRRYLAYPVWDALIFPIVELSQLPQLSPIGVRRFSPLDTHSLRPVGTDGQPLAGARDKLRGNAIHHFGGFFDKAWRENDYLWGRLDGVDLIMRLLSEHAAGTDLAAQVATGQRAALAAESATLTGVARMIDALQGQLAAANGAPRPL